MPATATLFLLIPTGILRSLSGQIAARFFRPLRRMRCCRSQITMPDSSSRFRRRLHAGQSSTSPSKPITPETLFPARLNQTENEHVQKHLNDDDREIEFEFEHSRCGAPDAQPPVQQTIRSDDDPRYGKHPNDCAEDHANPAVHFDSFSAEIRTVRTVRSVVMINHVDASLELAVSDFSPEVEAAKAPRMNEVARCFLIRSLRNCTVRRNPKASSIHLPHRCTFGKGFPERNRHVPEMIQKKGDGPPL